MTDIERAAEQEKILTRFRAYMDAHALSQSEAARLCAISAATLSQVLAGKYQGNVGRVAEAMDRALARAALRAQAPKRPPFARTSISEEVFAALEAAHTEGAIVLIQGDSGLGKTEAARRYVEGEPETALVTIRPGPRDRNRGGARGLLNQLADALRVGGEFNNNSSVDDVLRVLANAIRGAGRLIIVDEADYLSEGQLQILRMLHDETGCGVALLATPALLEHLRRQRSGTLSQVLNRIAYAVVLKPLAPADAEAILSPFALDAAGIQAAVDGAGGITRRLALGLVAAQRTGRKLDAALIRRAYAQLMPL